MALSRNDITAAELERLHVEGMRHAVCAPVKVLVERGVWKVPPEQRPANWRELGAKER